MGPLHDISGGQADLALNNLHRGHVALRERTAEYNAHVHEMQGQAEADKEYQQGLLQIAAEERKRRLAAAASERRLQEKQAAEEHGRMRAAEARALLEEIAEQKRQQKVAEDMAARELMVQQLAQQEQQRKAAAAKETADRQAAEAEAIRVHNQQLQQLANEEVQRQAAVQQAAVVVEPLYHDPPHHIDIDAAIQEHNRREREWIRGMHQVWQNERQAEEQMQLDELEEEQWISIADRNLHQRMMRLDELANNMSASQINQYQAQVAAHAEQIEMDREMAAALLQNIEPREIMKFN